MLKDVMVGSLPAIFFTTFFTLFVVKNIERLNNEHTKNRICTGS